MATVNNGLKPDQIEQLVKAIEKDVGLSSAPNNAFEALKRGPKFSDDHQTRLVNVVARSSFWAKEALCDLPWLAEEQKKGLRAVAV